MPKPRPYSLLDRGRQAPYPEIVRRIRRFLAVSLMAVLVVGTNAGLHAGDDDVCESTPVAGAGASHAQAAAPSSTRPEHCAICHWLESLRASSITHSVPPVPHRVSTPPKRYETRRALTANRFTLPLRAPPA